MAQIDIPRTEQGTTRVFSLSLTASEARSLRDTPMLQEGALGVERLNPQGIEIFALHDLGDMGLAGYLREGVDAQEGDLARDRTKLAALDGWVMLVHSSAFDGEPVTLTPAKALTLIGTYAQTTPDTAPVALEAEAAQPYSGTLAPAPARPSAGRSTGSLVVAVLAAIVIGALWWALT